MKLKAKSPLKRHTRGGTATYDDLLDFRQLNEEHQFDVLEQLHHSSRTAEFIAVISLFLAVCALFLGPIFQAELVADMAAGTAGPVVAGSFLGVVVLFFLLMWTTGYLLERRRRAYLYETFGREQPRQAAVAELVAFYQKPRRRWGRWGR